MQCERCFATNPEGATFCATCGTALAAAPTPPAAPEAPAFDADRTVARGTKLADILGGQPPATTPFQVPGSGGEAPPAPPTFEPSPSAPPAAPAFEAPAWGAPAAAAPTTPAFEQPPGAPSWQSSPPPAAPAWGQQQQQPPAPPAWGQQPPGGGYEQPGWAQTPPSQGGWPGGGGGFAGTPGAAYGGGYGAPTGQLADWGPRALAYLLDGVLAFAAAIVFLILGFIIHFPYLGFLASGGVSAWFGYQVGVSGSSPGMRVMGLRCISQQNGQPIGAGRGILRWLVHFVDGLLGFLLIGAILELVNLLFPLWDGQKQTLGDKFASSVVVTAPKSGFSLVPPAS